MLRSDPQRVRVLGIESSCDETGVALVEARAGRKPELVAQALHSQVELHREYGGVVPELASRDHIARVLPLLNEVLAQAGINLGDIDRIAYTRGPGLAGALLVGAGVACALGASLDRSVVGIHHLEGHLLSPFLGDDAPEFPFVALLVSGGHTQLMEVSAVGQYVLLGESIDDAAGEAFDKSAKLLGLGYPGGPALSVLAERGDAGRFALPRPLLHSGDLNFSFAGLKTAVMTTLVRLGTSVTQQDRADVAASAQAAIVDVLTRKTLAALRRTQSDRLVVAGGVAANRLLRKTLADLSTTHRFILHVAPPALCTDNGAMIAMASALRWQRGLDAVDGPTLMFDVRPRWSLAALSQCLAPL
jgi:N6-L-threonylcarbamoyladenine synthase